jgi:hypothetical protein
MKRKEKTSNGNKQRRKEVRRRKEKERGQRQKDVSVNCSLPSLARREKKHRVRQKLRERETTSPQTFLNQRRAIYDDDPKILLLSLPPRTHRHTHARARI